MRRLTIIILFLGLDVAGLAAQVSWKSRRNPDCQVVLTEALGVPSQDLHQYRFEGTCQTYREYFKNGRFDHRAPIGPVQLVRIDAEYDRTRGTYEEWIKVQSPVSGTIALYFGCPQDPVYQRVNCSLNARGRGSDEPRDVAGVWKEFYGPVLLAKASLTDAQAKSELNLQAAEERDRQQKVEAASTIGSARARPAPTGLGIAIPLNPTARVELADGTYLAGSPPGRLRRPTAQWHHMSARGGVITAFPPEALVYREADNTIVVWVGRSPTRLGRARS